MERKKYLHRYLNLEDFEGVYKYVGEVTAVTIDYGLVYTGCCQQAITETHDYDGKYIFDREIENLTVTYCQPEGETEPYSETYSKARVYKKGNVEIYDFYYCEDADDCSYDSERGITYLINDLTHFQAAGDVYLDVVNIERGDSELYHEPWVSYTTYSAATYSCDFCDAYDETHAKIFSGKLEYIGEVDYKNERCD